MDEEAVQMQIGGSLNATVQDCIVRLPATRDMKGVCAGDCWDFVEKKQRVNPMDYT